MRERERERSRADPSGLRGNSCRVACHANIWHSRDRAFSINFRPIFNFSQDALLCRAKQPPRRRQSRRSRCPPRHPSPSLGIRKHLGVANSGGVPRLAFSTVNARDGAHSMLLPFVFRGDGRNTGCLFIRELFVRSRVNSYSAKISRRQWSQNYKKL